MNSPLVLTRECDNCGGTEERVFVDSYTGKELCLMCLHPIFGRIALSPQTEKDNLEALLREGNREDSDPGRP